MADDLDQDAPPPSDKPKSPGIVKKTALKTPKELELEKQLKAVQTNQSKLEDRLDGIDGALKEVNSFLEGIFPSGKKPTAQRIQQPTRSALDDLADEIFG